MWDLPRPGLEPVCPALAGRFSTTVPPGKPNTYNLVWYFSCKKLKVFCKHFFLLLTGITFLSVGFTEANFTFHDFIICLFLLPRIEHIFSHELKLLCSRYICLWYNETSEILLNWRGLICMFDLGRELEYFYLADLWKQGRKICLAKLLK